MTWNRDDLAAGLAFLAIGLFFACNTMLSLDIGTAASMGPGFFPLALCVILVLLGATILLNARKRVGEVVAPFNLRAVILITAAPVAFGLTLRSLGMVPSLAITIALAVAASRTIGSLRGVAIVAGVTAFCVVVFYYGLQIPIELFNPAIFGSWSS
jgi:hypothetical protein